MQVAISPRQSKYCQAIETTITRLGHATNAQLLSELRKSFPDLSATTVHRATARLAERGKVTIAPSAVDGSMRYDANVLPHDHFMCVSCGILRDTDVKKQVVPILESSIGDCQISGQLTISGTCKNCMEVST